MHTCINTYQEKVTCASAAGFHELSTMMTREAAGRLSPTPPAFVVMRNACTFVAGLLNRLTKDWCFVCGLELEQNNVRELRT